MAECARSDIMAQVLDQGDMTRAAALLRASHNSERVVQSDGTSPYRWAATDAHIRRCMDDLASEDPERVLRAQLTLQPGRFGPAMAEVDRIVDIAQKVPGVVGAQLSGAGPYAMVLAREEAIAPLKRALRKEFYSSRDLPARIDISSFVEAAGAVDV